MNKLPENIRSLISASNQLNNHNTVVEELVYNALDAAATSLAIRINIEDNWLQVIDNGCGISKKDFRHIGKRYMTSKFTDISTLNSAPTKYGFRGLFLANVINLSRYVEVTSRYEKSEETYVKIFENGKEKDVQKINTRPSKGTTVLIKGFLYNLDIKKEIKNTLGDLQSIKKFLEHICLIQNNISISLRDDSKNEIVFTIHKNRDIYQTLSSLYTINKEDVQELQVEKNTYKIKGILGKSDGGCDRNVIFLNGKFICANSKLHEIVNSYVKRHLHNTNKNRRILKNKLFNDDDEMNIFQNKIPFYFIFITCPYMDYSLSRSSKKSVLEFKDWDQIKNLVEKLIKFYIGDVHLREIKSNPEDKAKIIETREEVKKIVEKILGAHSKQPGASLIHKGIKGKNVKRKLRKQSLSKSLLSNVKHSTSTRKKKHATYLRDEVTCKNTYDGHNLHAKDSSNRISKYKNYNESSLQIKKTSSFKPKITSKSRLRTKVGKKYISKVMAVSNYKCNDEVNFANKNREKIKSKLYKERLIQKKLKQELKKVHNIHSKNNLKKSFYNKNKGKHDFQNMKTMFHNQEGNNFYNNAYIKMNDSKSVTNRSNYPPKPYKSDNILNTEVEKVQTRFQSNYDLLKTVLKSQNNNNYIGRFFPMDEPESAFEKKTEENIKNNPISCVNPEITNYSVDPLVTYESHRYYVNRNYFNNEPSNIEGYFSVHKIPRKFITEQSKENFNHSQNYEYISSRKISNKHSKPMISHIKKIFNQASEQVNSRNHDVMSKIAESSYTIEFTKSISNKLINTNPYDSNLSKQAFSVNIEENRQVGSFQYTDCNENNNQTTHINANYTVTSTTHNLYSINCDNLYKYSTFSLEDYGSNIFAFNNNIKPKYEQNNYCKNYIFISKSDENDKNEQIIDPTDVCETIIGSRNISDMEIELSSNIKPKCSLEKSFCIPFTNLNINELNKEAIKDFAQESVAHEHKNCKPDSFIDIAEPTNLPNEEYIECDTEKNIEMQKQSYNSELVLESQPENKRSKFVNNLATNKSQNNKDKKIMFNIKNRPCFIPKGMSPILENCCTRNVCEYNLTNECYEDGMYNNFMDKVCNNVEVFESKIQEAQKDATMVIDKVNTKLNKDNSSLKFNGTSLYKANVLGQVDEKFIAAIIRDEYCTENPSEYLVLFDQHAVHERISLENNLSEYFIENQWVSINIEEFILKISRDEALFLHNYKDKFKQLGLGWDVLNGYEVSITALPAAILGKHLREVDKIIKAVKNLITEEITTIRMQSGCTSLYPKSIMDLVFSEACRYAIKFGEKLSNSRCAELLKALSECRTPFQCAHGRPVMAVIMEIYSNNHNYGVNMNKIKEWKAKYERFLK